MSWHDESGTTDFPSLLQEAVGGTEDGQAASAEQQGPFRVSPNLSHLSVRSCF